MGESPLVRGVRVQDLERIAELENHVFGWLGWPFFVLRQIYDIAGAWWLIVEHEEEICGYVLTGFQSDDKSVAWILGLGVHSDFRRHGYGEALMGAAISVLHRHGADVIRLSVRPDNKPARSLYEKLGFIDHHIVERNIFGPGEDRIILTRLLPVRQRRPRRLLVRLLHDLAAAASARLRRSAGPAVARDDRHRGFGRGRRR